MKRSRRLRHRRECRDPHVDVGGSAARVVAQPDALAFRQGANLCPELVRLVDRGPERVGCPLDERDAVHPFRMPSAVSELVQRRLVVVVGQTEL